MAATEGANPWGVTLRKTGSGVREGAGVAGVAGEGGGEGGAKTATGTGTPFGSPASQRRQAPAEPQRGQTQPQQTDAVVAESLTKPSQLRSKSTSRRNSPAPSPKPASLHSTPTSSPALSPSLPSRSPLLQQSSLPSQTHPLMPSSNPSPSFAHSIAGASIRAAAATQGVTLSPAMEASAARVAVSAAKDAGPGAAWKLATGQKLSRDEEAKVANALGKAVTGEAKRAAAENAPSWANGSTGANGAQEKKEAPPIPTRRPDPPRPPSSNALISSSTPSSASTSTVASLPLGARQAPPPPPPSARPKPPPPPTQTQSLSPSSPSAKPAPAHAPAHISAAGQSASVPAPARPALPPRLPARPSESSFTPFQPDTTRALPDAGPKPPSLPSRDAAAPAPPLPARRGIAAPLVPTPASPPSGGAASGPAPVSAGARARYDELFGKMQRAGKVEGADVVEVWSRSMLEAEELKQVWALSDIDRDGRLTAHEFALGMHIIDDRLRGIPIPSTLSRELRWYGEGR
ncbi:hypothetical protein M427DRAFT_54189 [Gonapodya prolifera JEL478]|uniref:EF-hand domain-containing protein n=1 Tax=Gonapodya prolifera (strain JEL478) TaxID=1344416 RepID=A0A139AMJ4_GONPJ|nr:hypothetical protein M427DRAFT_54189 [Gonapodya prolifera JEL478]|eukprot:KXS17969.1 hypothetical protein M427DRAFT_54189 [Gonapodya prolifera JEL478]